jgi:molecular chaperone DnaJ
MVERHRKVLVTFPAGIDGGQRLRVPGQGMPGPSGAMPGDLYVDVELEPDERFQRSGSDLGMHHSISFADAALGCTFEVELPDGSRQTVEAKPGTQPGTVVKVAASGIPRLDRSGRGDLHVMLDVKVPSKLSKRAKKLLLELDRELSGGEQLEANTG